MKLKFDPNLEYQINAINSVIDLFEGIPSIEDETYFSIVHRNLELVEIWTGNRMILDEAVLMKNLGKIQERNNVEKSKALINDDTYSFPNFSVEMETGTGKTYVYLRTIFELNRKYGLKKFIIVVPSIAIREGVLSSISSMRMHFEGLYDKVPFDHFVYNSSDLSNVRPFAISDKIQIMIINIQAFNKKEEKNIFNQERDNKLSGRSPREFVQAVRPVVIIDEPQSVDNTEVAKKSITLLNPLFCLRYSATHIHPYNLLYRLGPIEAYDMKIVKQIEVASIQTEATSSETYIKLEFIGYTKNSNTPHARVIILEDSKTGTKEIKVTLKLGTDLSNHTSHSGYDGYIVREINAEKGSEYVEFTNGKMLRVGEEIGGNRGEVLKKQIFQTVEEHLRKEKEYSKKGIKVLSLFFLDKVSNYRWYDEDGASCKGKVAEYFENVLDELMKKPVFKDILPFKVDQLHDGYFSVDKKKGKTFFKDSSGTTQADDDAYHLIMKDKERLLSPEEPLRFIFSHSALREGWDNPNVFQICSIREIGTERERRQTLGRGLRLPVNKDGERVFDENINKLTVIANESFEEYARNLQNEIEKECNIEFGKVSKIAFSNISIDVDSGPIGQEESQKIWHSLIRGGYLDSNGKITDKYNPKVSGRDIELPKEYLDIRSNISDILNKHLFTSRIVNAREKRQLKYNKRIELNEDFKVLWEKISKRTKYSVEFKSVELINKAIKKIKEMDKISPLKILVEKTDVDISKAGVEGGKVTEQSFDTITYKGALPDILSFLQKETELTRKTLAEILIQSDRLKEFQIHPQKFMNEVSIRINKALNEMILDGIKYERIDGHNYEMRLFEQNEIINYLNNLYEIQSKDDRTPYDYIPFESNIERDIAERLDSHQDIKFFCKLPCWFKIPTPVGDYNPDWAIVKNGDEKLYLVRETKGTTDPDQRRGIENQKIKCGKAHFDALNVDYKVVTNFKDILEPKKL